MLSFHSTQIKHDMNSAFDVSTGNKGMVFTSFILLNKIKFDPDAVTTEREC